MRFKTRIPSYFSIVLSLGESKDMSTISKELDMTYASVVQRIKELESMGVVKTNKTGKSRITKLTDRGNDLRNHIKAIVNLFPEFAYEPKRWYHENEE